MARGVVLEGGDRVRRDAMVLMVIVAALGPGVEAAVELGEVEVASGVDVGCTRPLLDLIHGFLLTLLALTVAFWGSWKHVWSSDKPSMLLGLTLGVFAPILDVGVNVEDSCHCVAMLWKYHHFPSPDDSSTDGAKQGSKKSPFRRSLSSLSPFSKSPIRILAASHDKIIIYVSEGSELLENKVIWCHQAAVFVESEAMVIGEVSETEKDRYIRKQLYDDGILAMVLAGVLPKYDELKFLRGNSGFAMIAVLVQAIGYIYAVVYRSATDLEVAPLEVIGLVFNIYLLIKASLFSTCNPCHRPLVIFMNKEKDEQLVNFLSKHDKEHFEIPDSHRKTNMILFAILVISNGVLIYYIVQIIKSTNVIITMPLIILFANSLLEYIFMLLLFKNKGSVHKQDCSETIEMFSILLLFIVPSVKAIVYVWAIVVTVVYWKSEHFDTRAQSINLSQLVPFIG